MLHIQYKGQKKLRRMAITALALTVGVMASACSGGVGNSTTGNGGVSHIGGSGSSSLRDDANDYAALLEGRINNASTQQDALRAYWDTLCDAAASLNHPWFTYQEQLEAASRLDDINLDDLPHEYSAFVLLAASALDDAVAAGKISSEARGTSFAAYLDGANLCNLP